VTLTGIHLFPSGIKNSSHLGPLVFLRRERLDGQAERSLVAD
jgi:hypothetical protein